MVVFDCDGVLVDSEILAIEIESRLLNEAGFAMSEDEIAETCIGLSYGDMAAMLEERFGRPIPDDLNHRMQAEVVATFPERLRPVAGLVELLSANSLSRCVASSSNLDRINLSLETTGLRALFSVDSIFSAQMVERGKPAPDLFLHAARQLSVDPADCIVVEDSPHGVTAARAAGMAVVGFVGGGHARPTLVDRLQNAGAATIADDAEELGHVLDLWSGQWRPGPR